LLLTETWRCDKLSLVPIYKLDIFGDAIVT